MSLAQIIAKELERQADESLAFFSNTNMETGEPTFKEVGLDGRFDLEKLAEVIEQHLKERTT